VSVFFNHLYHSEDVENEIEIEDRIKTTPAVIAESYFKYRNYRPQEGCLNLENYSFELLLKCLAPEKVMFLVTCLLLERKLVLIKESCGDIAIIMESLVGLLYPLKWNFVFISYLAPHLVECLDAPFPYVIGVSRKVWLDHCVTREYSEDVVIFDIDRQEKLNSLKEELPGLPEPQASILLRSLRELLDMRERFTEEIPQDTGDELVGKIQERLRRQPKEAIDEYYWSYAQLRVKQSFFNFFLMTINNYSAYYKQQGKHLSS